MLNQDRAEELPVTVGVLHEASTVKIIAAVYGVLTVVLPFYVLTH